MALTFRWAFSPATLLIALDHAAPLRVQVRAQAFNYPGAPPQMMAIRQRTSERPAPSRRSGRQLSFEVGGSLARRREPSDAEFSRTQRPADVGLGGDGRLLSAGIDYLRVEVVEPAFVPAEKCVSG